MVFRLYNRIFAGCQLEVAAIQIRRKQLRSLEADEAAKHRFRRPMPIICGSRSTVRSGEK